MNNRKNVQNAVIILAGGRSQRAEMIKGLRQVNDEYWVDSQIKYFKKMGIQKVFVGLGYDNKEYLSSSKQLNLTTYAINPRPENGSFSTLQTTLKEALKKDWGKIVLIHIDHAIPKPETLTSLLQPNHFAVVKPTFNNTSGHPIVLSRSFCKILINKTCESQLNLLIRELIKTQVHWVEVHDKSILENFNNKEDWQNRL